MNSPWNPEKEPESFEQLIRPRVETVRSGVGRVDNTIRHNFAIEPTWHAATAKPEKVVDPNVMYNYGANNQPTETNTSAKTLDADAIRQHIDEMGRTDANQTEVSQ
jgi:hypothetical protein